MGNVVVFAPQIAFLFLMIAFLEDLGYLPRAAFLIDRIMANSGLTGRAFVPMLSGYACAVPAILATRTLARRRDRLLTMLTIPLTSCSARLPVYVLVTAVVFSPQAGWGPFHPGAVVLFVMYALSLIVAIAAATVLGRTVLAGRGAPMVLELPPYRLPLLSTVLGTVWERVRVFLVDAGTIIVAMSVVLWVMLHFPHSHEVADRYAAARSELAETAGATRGQAWQQLEAAEAAEQLAYSAAGRVGHLIEPLLKPIGQDWRIGVGILGAFAAREVFVGTLGIVWGVGDGAGASLREQLQQATWPDGRPLFTPASGAALLVFFLLACQCMSTLAAVRRESGSWRWPALLFGYMSLLAWAGAFVVYQVGRAVGWG